MNAKIWGAIAVALVLGACGGKQEEAASVVEEAAPAVEEAAPAATEVAPGTESAPMDAAAGDAAATS